MFVLTTNRPFERSLGFVLALRTCHVVLNPVLHDVGNLLIIVVHHHPVGITNYPSSGRGVTVAFPPAWFTNAAVFRALLSQPVDCALNCTLSPNTVRIGTSFKVWGELPAGMSKPAGSMECSP